MVTTPIEILVITDLNKEGKHDVKAMKGKVLVDIIQLPKRFWAKPISYNKFKEFAKENGKVFTEEEVKQKKLELEEKWKKQFENKEKKVSKKDMPQEVKDILTDENLLELIDKEFSKKIVNEFLPRKIVFIFCIGRLLKNQEATSFNLCLSDDSGKGKDYVIDNVLGMFEEGEDKDYIKTEKITPEVLDSLSKKVVWTTMIFYNADVRTKILDSETFKVFASGSTIFYTHKDGEAIKTEINGKPTMLITTAKGVSNDELTRRFLNAKLTSDKNQTKEIMRQKARFKAKGIKEQYDKNIIKALTYLKEVRVLIPFSEKIVDYFPSEHRIMRTQWSRFLDMISAVTTLYQFQREVKDGYHLATWEDYDTAIEMLEYLLSNNKQIPLSNTDEKIIKAMRKLGNELRISEIEAETHLVYNTIKDRLNHLADFDLVEVRLLDTNIDMKIYKPTLVYSLNNFDVEKLPRSKDIVNNEIDEIDENTKIDEIDENTKSNFTKFTNFTKLTTSKNNKFNENDSLDEIEMRLKAKEKPK
tara:strand:- start:1764 stop:3350 length:1587 start_codon:yes stop_codon:yes gene_type:complete